MPKEERSQPIDSLAFLGLWALSTLHLCRTGFLDRFIDEDTHIATGWLLAKGLVLYRDIFTHHMPVDYMPAWLVATLFDNRFAAYRAWMIGLWAVVCLCLFLFWRSAGRVAAWAAILFTVLSALWLPYWGGQMMLVECFWGYALLLALVYIGSPLGLRVDAPNPWRAAAAGFLLTYVASASPTCVLPVGCLAVWLAGSARWRASWRFLISGAGAWLGLLWIWCWGRVDFALIPEHVWSFNAEVYARFHGIEGANSVFGFLATALSQNLRYYATVFSWGDPPGFFDGLLKLAVLGGLVFLLLKGERLKALWWAVFLICVKARAEFFHEAMPFHSAAFYLLATLLVSLEFSELFRAALEVSRLRAAALALAGLTASLASLAATSPDFRGIKAYPHGDPSELPVIEAISQGSDPGDRIAVFPNASRIYFETSRLPAVPNVFYLPWQAAWAPQRTATLDALRRNTPKFVTVKYGKIWGIPWTRYAPDIEEMLSREYVPVVLGDQKDPAGSILYVSRTYQKEFERRVR